MAAASTGSTMALALCLADALRPCSRDRSSVRWAAEACNEVEQCGAVPCIVALMASHDLERRAAGAAAAKGLSVAAVVLRGAGTTLHWLACTHALSVNGNLPTRMALGSSGAVVSLVDAVRHEGVALPGSLQPPICAPSVLGQAAAEALASLASSSDPLRKDVCMQLSAFLASSSLALAASACHALSLVVAEAPAAGQTLLALPVLTPLVAHIARGPPAKAKGESADLATLELLHTRAVRLLFGLCRGGGGAVDATVAAAGPAVLLQRLTRAPDVQRRLEAAAALGPLLRKSAAARDVVAAGGGLDALLELARIAPAGSPQWAEALVPLAALAALHGPSRAEAALALRQMLVRGATRGEVAAAVLVVARMASSPAGREVVLAEELTPQLVRLLASGDDRTKAAAANAICHLAVPGPPRLALIKAGAVQALLALLREPGAPAAPRAHQPPGPTGTAEGAAAAAVLAAVAEALECIAAGEEGVACIRAAGGVEVLKDTVGRGKRRLVPEAVAKAASVVLLKCM
ncbi:hypothetical protein TSOC_002896 [Tetrabaena socialis]|uniref:Vacuolar protein 8 n=1 Tax=Tetrabaena socialis TaxID=47790 RepID=A0A2J8ACY1_9CHLO|nr:hypothetical protein TSOC_002896 [Tetrabaena socialis]|eukprot:PNH10370.1 hypothetical protein TSOC_002896 [Tetrabaena socialis]